jgi:hypothetical protein
MLRKAKERSVVWKMTQRRGGEETKQRPCLRHSHHLDAIVIAATRSAVDS